MMTEAASAVPLWRLYVLRALYALILVGQGSIQFPRLLHAPSDFWHGVGMCMLAALAATSALGVLHPLRMLPVLLFEFVWKLLWVLSVAVPEWQSHTMSADVSESVFEIGLGIVLCPLIIPWGYFFKHYLQLPGERWR